MFPTSVPTNPQAAAAAGIAFFTAWIARVGGVVALIGMMKFALSVRNEDARESISALLTAVSGYIIMEYVSRAFTFSTGTTAIAEFNALMLYVTKWLRRVGSAAGCVPQEASSRHSRIRTIRFPMARLPSPRRKI